MEHGFPPSANDTIWLPIHCVMLTLAAAAVAGNIRLRTTPAVPGTLLRWTLLLFGAPAMAYINWLVWPTDWHRAVTPSSIRTTLFVYVVLIWGICLLGNFITSKHLREHKRNSTPAIAHATCNMLIPIFIFLICALLPPKSTVREAGRRSHCRSTLKKIGLALSEYADIHQELPQSTTGNPPTSWRIHISPFIENDSVFMKYDQSKTWDSQPNITMAKQRFHPYQCSSRMAPTADNDGRFFTDYTMPTGEGTLSDSNRRSLESIADGASNTLTVVEASGLNIVWTEPRDAYVSDEPLGFNLKGRTDYDSPGFMSSWHYHGAHGLFADGSTRFISQDIDPTVLKALTTVNGGESLPDTY